MLPDAARVTNDSPSAGACDRGQATVELALALPVLALLLGALVEVGMLVADQARLWHAAREAARVAVVDPDSDAARHAAEEVGLTPLQVDIRPDPGSRRQGEALTVQLAYEPPGRVPLLAQLLSGTVLRAQATMRIERP